MYYQNRLGDLLWQLQQQQMQQPPNMLAQAQGFDPNGIVAQMLAQQRAAEAARAAQAQKAKPQPRPQTPYGVEPAESTLQRRMREQGLY